MPHGFASALLTVALSASILPPGYPAYIGSYIALGAALVALLAYGWPERATFRHLTCLAILAAIALVAGSLPFVYRGSEDLMAPILILPMLATVGLGLLARPARWVPGYTLFALICLLASLIALIGGGYEAYLLGTYRPGLGNNPIHYASLAALSGCLALVGVPAGRSPWRYGFLLGPIFALGCAIIADSRGPMLGALAMSAAGAAVLTIWLWHDKWFRVAMLAGLALAAGLFALLLASGNTRVAGIIQSGLDIFRFTGSSDDVRVALYASALEVMRTSPLTGVGLGQILDTAETMFPQLVAEHGFDHLHADWANFAAMAGGMGLLAWLLLLAAPPLLLIDRRARQDRPIVLGAVILTIGQFALGVSNATFGVLPQTTVYAVALGYLLVRARRLASAD